VNLDPVHDRTETSSIALETLCAKSDIGASLQFDCSPMALPYLPERQLEVFWGCIRLRCSRELDASLNTDTSEYGAVNLQHGQSCVFVQ
jgi:hypothetical protein